MIDTLQRNKAQSNTTANTEDTLADILSINADWRNNRESTIARYAGIKAAKSHAAIEITNLLYWGRKLSYAVIFVSAIHIWETVSRIAPENATALLLWPAVYHVAALLFTVIIDIVAVFLLKAETALAYTKNNPNKAIWFFYFVTAVLNGAFIAANSPDATAALKNGLVEWYGNLFIILLPLTVPVALWAIERTNQRLEVGKITLTVDIATLDGLIRSNKNNAETAPLNRVLEQNSYPEGIVPPDEALTCMKCGALLPDMGSVKKNQGKRMSTKRFGCEQCKTGK